MTKQNQQFDVRMSKPNVVAQASPEVKQWGHWQFPSIERLADGRLHVEFSIHKDSIVSYGKPVGHAVSDDNGLTWNVPERPDDLEGGLLLAGGDRLKPHAKVPEKLAERDIQLPKPLGVVDSYGNLRTIYRASDIPDLYSGRFLRRKRKGESQWKVERTMAHFPEETRFTAEGVLPYPSFCRLKAAPDGSLWGLAYPYLPDERSGRMRMTPVFFRSDDEGHNWHVQSTIPYRGEAAVDPKQDDREGFSEPDIAFMPDGSVIGLLRTTDGLGLGPLYSTRSADNGRTWSRPALYESYGVWPTLLVLKSGYTLAAYGRLGLYLNVSNDPEGLRADRKLVIVPPGEYQKDTCSYCGLLALDDHSILIVYSDFQYPNGDGVPCKTILVRKIAII